MDVVIHLPERRRKPFDIKSKNGGVASVFTSL